jgi:hypothetical protein
MNARQKRSRAKLRAKSKPKPTNLGYPVGSHTDWMMLPRRRPGWPSHAQLMIEGKIGYGEVKGLLTPGK